MENKTLENGRRSVNHTNIDDNVLMFYQLQQSCVCKSSGHFLNFHFMISID
jgi:hypothetical protein